jgi:hypothetical protein
MDMSLHTTHFFSRAVLIFDRCKLQDAHESLPEAAVISAFEKPV